MDYRGSTRKQLIAELERRDCAGDTAGRKRNRDLLRESLKKLDLLHRIDVAALDLAPVDQIGMLAAAGLRQLLDCSYAAVIEFDENVHEGVCIGRDPAAGPPSGTDRRFALASYPGLWNAWMGRDSAIIHRDDGPELPPCLESGCGDGILLWNPMNVRGARLGALVIECSDVRLCDARAGHVRDIALSFAVVLQHARLYRRIRQEAETNTLLIQEINHRVKNNLLAILGLLNLEQSGGERDIGHMLEDLRARIGSMAAVHDLLSARRWSPLHLGEIADRIIRGALNGFVEEGRVRVSIREISRERLLPRQATEFGLVLNELVTNSIKYALPDRSDAEVALGIRRCSEDPGTVVMDYRDNGPGWPVEVLCGSGERTGLRVIRLTVERTWKGSLRLSNDRGACIRISFPKLP